MVKISSVLGLNARASLFSYKHNSKKGRRIAANKILTEKVLNKADIPTPKIYAKFEALRQLNTFDWSSLPSSFALKPSKGLGGKGIVVVKKRTADKEAWVTTERDRIGVNDIKLHISDILEGAYSMGDSPDLALIQEYVGRHKAFRKYAYRGTPDIRVIVFNKVPIMAMLRLPTKESGGRANLHQGAIAVGIDIATGITTKAIWHGNPIRLKPGTKRKLHGIKIPNWTKILEMAVDSGKAADLGYLGVDVVLHPDKGPMVLELNSQPGLTIQIANMAGLKKRLERVEDLRVKNEEHGVKIAKALFSADFADRVKAKEGIKNVNIFEDIKIKSKAGKKITIPAKIDTGAMRTSIDETLAKDMGLLEESNILLKRYYKSALGGQVRPVIGLTFWLKGKKIKTIAGVTDRSKLTKPVIIGRSDLTGFLVDPTEKIE